MQQNILPTKTNITEQSPPQRIRSRYRAGMKLYPACLEILQILEGELIVEPGRLRDLLLSTVSSEVVDETSAAEYFLGQGALRMELHGATITRNKRAFHLSHCNDYNLNSCIHARMAGLFISGSSPCSQSSENSSPQTAHLDWLSVNLGIVQRIVFINGFDTGAICPRDRGNEFGKNLCRQGRRKTSDKRGFFISID